MPYSKDISKYPAQFISLIDAKLPFRWPLRDAKQARHYRFLIYGFIEALRSQKHPGAATLSAMLFRVENNELVVTKRDDEEALKALDAILMAQMTEQVPTPLPAPEPKPTAPYESHSEDYIEKTYGNRETPLLSQPCGGIFVHGPFNDKCYRCGHPMLAHTTSEASSPNSADAPAAEEKK